MKEENVKSEYQRKVDKSLIPTCNIMGVNIAAINMNWLLKYIDENLSDIKGDYICVSNVHKEEWAQAIPVKPVLENDYIFCYFLGANSEHRKVAEELSKKTGIPLYDDIIPLFGKYENRKFINFALSQSAVPARDSSQESYQC